MQILATVSKDRSLQICFRCHAVKDVVRPGYVPGQPFEEHYSLGFPMLSEGPLYPDGRIRTFAEAQRASLDNMTAPVTGGQAGQRIRPVERAGCYAPGGRFPMPSSVLMTAVTARVAGVSQVGRCIPRWQYRVVGEPGH